MTHTILKVSNHTMNRRLSYAEKGKGLADPEPPRTARVRVPAVDTSELIRIHSLTLVGRITNPKFQRLWSLFPFFGEHWKVETSPVGADVGQDYFQFQFAAEKDIFKVLEDRPYHFAHWMLILQRWEPSTSPSFPNQIPFWVQFQGIPLHMWSDVALTSLADDIGTLDKMEITSTKALMKVFIDGLKPLIKKSTLDFDSGDEIEVTLEKLEKHCSLCCMLDHGVQECPVKKLIKSTESATTHPSRSFKDNQRRRDYSESRSRSISRSIHQIERDSPHDPFPVDSDRRPLRSKSNRTEENKEKYPSLRSKQSKLPYARRELSNYYSPKELDADTFYHSREYRRPDNFVSDMDHPHSKQKSASIRQVWIEKPSNTG